MKISSFTTDERSRVADRVRCARYAAKLTKSGLAARVGVTPSAAAQWEHPRGTSPGVHRLEAIAAATGVNFSWLATGRGDQQRGQTRDEEVPALKLDGFARDAAEEQLLDRFRMLPQRAKDLLCGFLGAVQSQRR